MKTIIVREPGGPHVLELIDTPLPEPGPHQVRIRVTAASLNPIGYLLGWAHATGEALRLDDRGLDRSGGLGAGVRGGEVAPRCA